MKQNTTGKTYLDDLPAEALCEGGSKIYRSILKGYIPNDVYEKYRERYKQCIRMLNGLEKSLERHLPEQERRWAGGEDGEPNTEH